MTRDDITAKVREIFAKEFGADLLEKFGDHPKPFESMVAEAGNPGATQLLDSLDHVEFVMALEDGFGIQIEDGSGALIRNLEDAINAVDTRLNQPVSAN